MFPSEWILLYSEAMLILALDASLARCSVALSRGGLTLAARQHNAARGQAALLPPMVQEVLAEAGVSAAELGAVAAVVGPGGFTGIRAALSLAQGLAMGVGVPVIGVSTGEALAEGIPAHQRAGHEVWAATDNRRGQVVLERFAPGGLLSLGPHLILAEADLPRPTAYVVVAGDAAPQVAARLAARGFRVVLSDARLPEAAAVARAAAQRLAGQRAPLAAEPLYLEPPAVRLP